MAFVRECLIKSKFYPEIIAFDIRDIFFFFFYICIYKVKFLWNRNNRTFYIMHAGNSSLFHIFFYIFLSQAKLYILLVILCFRNFSRVNNYLLPKFEQIHSKKLIKIVIVLIPECPKRILNDRKMEEKKFVEEIKSHRLQWKISHNCTEVTLPPPLFLSIHLSSPINLPIWNRLKKDGEGKKRREREGEGKKNHPSRVHSWRERAKGRRGKKKQRGRDEEQSMEGRFPRDRGATWNS